MFAIGDPVVYPMHGAGTIDDITGLDVMGEAKPYYVIALSEGITVMVPVDTAEENGLRPLTGREEALAALEYVRGNDLKMEENWNRRYRENILRLREGSLQNAAAVAKALLRRNCEKSLSAGEKKLLETARRHAETEASLIFSLNETQAAEFIGQFILS